MIGKPFAEKPLPLLSTFSTARTDASSHPMRLAASAISAAVKCAGFFAISRFTNASPALFDVVDGAAGGGGGGLTGADGGGPAAGGGGAGGGVCVVGCVGAGCAGGLVAVGDGAGFGAGFGAGAGAVFLRPKIRARMSSMKLTARLLRLKSRPPARPAPKG
jgi:hypothetical protein